MSITTNRLKHSLEVAKRMKDLIIKFPEKYPLDIDDAFVLGFIHDIGYEFANNQIEHAHTGGLVLEESNYKYWKEVYYHGVKQKEYSSPMLTLLNHADMTVGPSGESLSISERLLDISNRYGANSWQELQAIELSTSLL